MTQTPMQDVEWGECLVEPKRDRDLERYVRRGMGVIPPAAPYLAHCPWLARALVTTNARKGLLVHVNVPLAELIFLVVSQDNSCRYCYASQRVLMRISGFSEERIRAIEQDWLAADLDSKDRAALAFARRVSRANPRPDADDVDRLLAAGWNDEGVAEIAFLAGSTVTANRVTSTLGVPPESSEELVERWWFRLLRPLLALRVNAGRGPGQRVQLTPDEKSGPFGRRVGRFDGLPVGRALSRLYDEVWSSPLTSRRSKGLVFAVIARTLGCPSTEREARELLAPEGIDGDHLDEILAHLASPKLDEVDSALLPFARETVWAQPIQLQHRARELRSLMDAPAFVEIVGVMAIANSLGRTGFLSDRG